MIYHSAGEVRRALLILLVMVHSFMASTWSRLKTRRAVSLPVSLPALTRFIMLEVYHLNSIILPIASSYRISYKMQ